MSKRSILKTPPPPNQNEDSRPILKNRSNSVGGIFDNAELHSILKATSSFESVLNREDTKKSCLKVSKEKPTTVLDRIRELKISGENDWKKRVEKKTEIKTKTDLISSRQNLLTTKLNEDWKGRIPVKDNAEFSVRGRIEKAGIVLEEGIKLDPFKSHAFNFEKKFDKPKKKILFKESYINKIELAESAKAGLESTEDFSKIKLKKLEKMGHKKNVQLHLFKGRRFVQSRLIKNNVSNVNDGDVFVLSVDNEVHYKYNGKYANLLEKSKSEEMFSRLKGEKKLVDFEGRNWREFLSYLKDGIVTMENNLGDFSDENYERKCFLKVYDWEFNFLTDLQPGFDFLQGHKVLLFDYETEFYVWCGSCSSLENKRIGFEKAVSLTESREFCCLEKIYQFMEPVWFVSKFFDWPSDSSLKTFGDEFFMPSKLNEIELGNVEEIEEESGLVLEGFDLGKTLGDISRVSDEDIRWRSIGTVLLEKWAVDENGSINRIELNNIFLTTGCYVIRWVYNIEYLAKDLKGNVSSIPVSKGRDRICWFFWYGSKVSVIQRASVGAVFSNQDHSVFDDFQGVKLAVEELSEPELFKNLFKPMKIMQNSKSPKIFLKTKNVLKEIETSFINENYFYEFESIKNLQISKDKIVKVFEFNFDKIIHVKLYKEFHQMDFIFGKNYLYFIEGVGNSFLLWETGLDPRYNGYRTSVLKSIGKYVKNETFIIEDFNFEKIEKKLSNLLAYWEGVVIETELVELNSDLDMINQFESCKHFYKDIVSNYRYFNYYLDRNNLINLIVDSDLINLIGYDLNGFNSLPPWKRNQICKLFWK